MRVNSTSGSLCRHEWERSLAGRARTAVSSLVEDILILGRFAFGFDYFPKRRP